MVETHGWHFASFYLDLGAERLWHGADAVHLTAKAFGVLRHLVAHAGQLVTKDELVAAVWATPYVSEAALAVCIRELRQALGDTALTPQYVETVRGRGYRFVTTVTSTAVLGTGGGTARQALDRPGLVVEREPELGVLQRCWA